MRVAHFALPVRSHLARLCLCLIIGSNLPPAICQSVGSVELSAADRAQLVADILARQLAMRDGVFSQTWRISTRNIEPMRDPLIAGSGFRLITPDEIERLTGQSAIEYQVFQKFAYKDGRAEVTLMRVAEGETCFSGHMSSKAVTTYFYRQEGGKWVCEGAGRPAPSRPVFGMMNEAFL